MIGESGDYDVFEDPALFSFYETKSQKGKELLKKDVYEDALIIPCNIYGGLIDRLI